MVVTTNDKASKEINRQRIREIKEIITKHKAQWVGKTPQPHPVTKAIQRQDEIKSVILELGHAKASQISERLYPGRQPPTTFWRDLKYLENKKLIQKIWTRKDGEFYIATEPSSMIEPYLINELVISTGFLEEQLIWLQNEFYRAIEEKRHMDLEATGVLSFDRLEFLTWCIWENVKELKPALYPAFWKPKNTSEEQPPEKARPNEQQLEDTETPEPMECPQCGGTVFNTDPEDGREVCAKCGLEKKT